MALSAYICFRIHCRCLRTLEAISNNRSTARAILVILAGAGLAAGIAATALGTRSQFFKILIAGGVDALSIGIAGLLLLLIFRGKKPAPPTGVIHQSPRSLDRPEAGDLKTLLLEQLAPNEPVNLIFPADDLESQEFAKQIAAYLAENGFLIGKMAAGLSSLPFVPGIGIGETNQVIVGPR